MNTNNSSEKLNFPKLFSPIQIRKQTIRNRLIMGSMHTGLEDTLWSLDKLAAFYERRAQGGVGLIITGGFSPNIQGWLTPFSSTLNSQWQISKHKKLTDRVHSAGAKIALQILHAGRYSYHPLSVSPSGIKSPITPFKPKKMSVNGIKGTISDYVRCAELAEKSGYDGIEIMGSEGYLINQFISAKTNKRTDDWGGSFENRIRFPIEIVKAIREKVSDKFMIIFRLSLLEFVTEGNSLSENIELGKRLEAAGVDILGTGIGWHEARIPTIATDVPRGAFVWASSELKKNVSIPVITSNRINTPELAEKIISNDQADFISMARPWLADPDFAVKAQQGHKDLINTCIACNQACLDHIFSRKRATCLVNPQAGYETEYLLEKTSSVKKIAVIGSGPAGLSFAVTAAERGHHVEIFDRNSEIGGQFLVAKNIPGKAEFNETLRYFTNKLQALGVKVHLNKNLDKTEIDKLSFDKVVFATGIKPRTPEIKNLKHSSKVVSYLDILKGTVAVQKRVGIIGAGGIGFDTAKFVLEKHLNDFSEQKNNKEINSEIELANIISDFEKEWGISKDKNLGGSFVQSKKNESAHDQNNQIFLMQRKQESLGKNLGKTTGWIHRLFLKNHGVQMLSGVEYKEINDKGIIISINHKEQQLELDQIIICAGQISDDFLYQESLSLEALEHFKKSKSVENKSSTNQIKNINSNEKFFLIGGARKALELDAKEAIRDGFLLGLKI